jgi:hypothetical protein
MGPIPSCQEARRPKGDGDGRRLTKRDGTVDRRRIVSVAATAILMSARGGERPPPVSRVDMLQLLPPETTSWKETVQRTHGGAGGKRFPHWFCGLHVRMSQ